MSVQQSGLWLQNTDDHVTHSSLDFETQSMYSNPMQFYDFLQNQIKVLFKPRYDDTDYKQEFEVTLSKKMTYDMVSFWGYS